MGSGLMSCAMTSPPKDLIDVFKEGVDARGCGRPESMNPYPAGTRERQEWLEGWSATFDLDEDDDPCSNRIRSDQDTV